MLESIECDESHLLRLARETEVTHEESQGFNALFDSEISKIQATIFGGTKDDCLTHAAVIAHFLKSCCNHRALEAIELTIREVTHSKRVADAAQEN